MSAVKKTQELLKKRIAACQKRHFLPVELLALIEAVYAIQLESRADAQICLEKADIADAVRRGQGAPLVERSLFPFDREQTARLFHQFLEIAAQSVPALGKAGSDVAEAVRSGALDLDQAMQAHLDNNEPFFSTWTTAPAPRLVPMLVQAAMTPSLERAAEILSSGADLAASWPHGHCPVCGSLPIMSDLQEKEGIRYNICGFCHAKYRVPRMQCPFCLENDPAKLEYYDAQEEPGLRINACTTCGMYIKQTDFRDRDRVSLPLVDDLESLGLDLAAQEQGFKRPTLSAWGF